MSFGREGGLCFGGLEVDVSCFSIFCLLYAAGDVDWIRPRMAFAECFLGENVKVVILGARRQLPKRSSKEVLRVMLMDCWTVRV